MMDSSQKDAVTIVYNRFMDQEGRGWDQLDDTLDLLEYLDDDQLYREASVLYSYQEHKNPRCPQDHHKSKCFIPVVIEAVSAILELYQDSPTMHPKNRYILQYYLAISQSEGIVTD